MKINKRKTRIQRVRLAALTLLDTLAHPFLLPVIAMVALAHALYWMPLNVLVIILTGLTLFVSIFCLPFLATIVINLINNEKRVLRPRKRKRRQVMAIVSLMFLVGNWIGFQFTYSVPPVAQLLLLATVTTLLYVVATIRYTVDGYALGLGTAVAYLTGLSLIGMVGWPWPVALLTLTGLEAWLSIDTRCTTAKRFIVSFVTGVLIAVPFIIFAAR